ncbi:uncharacterized protein LOC119465305 isoform X2 [Dermacentor silvarum]|uniref:uncharacterized protein LOC119465305 isoform X2 n=1 Tax=Dermacentor silvarum TaxID=543639 RepID=UPI00210114AB|nr:uncharacterized protein LOC119465305 isoform X2 [Dermacentor silvarum]
MKSSMEVSVCFFVTILFLQSSATELPEICTSPRLMPTCTGNLFKVYYYDSGTEQCLPENTCVSTDSFKTLRDCQETCLRKKGTEVSADKRMPLFQHKVPLLWLLIFYGYILASCIWRRKGQIPYAAVSFAFLSEHLAKKLINA